MRLALYVCLKNICDGVGRQNGSNGTPLDPPLFWLDNIFNSLQYGLEKLHTGVGELRRGRKNRNIIYMDGYRVCNSEIVIKKLAGPFFTQLTVGDDSFVKFSMRTCSRVTLSDIEKLFLRGNRKI